LARCVRKSIAVSPAGDCIAAGTEGGSVYMWKGLETVETVDQSGCYIAQDNIFLPFISTLCTWLSTSRPLLAADHWSHIWYSCYFTMYTLCPEAVSLDRLISSYLCVLSVVIPLD
jgi:hypothetical protein